MNEISRTTGIEKAAVQTTVEAFMEAIKGSVMMEKMIIFKRFWKFCSEKES